MEKQKRFKKQEIDSKDDKGMEIGAKVLKGGVTIAALCGLAVRNKDGIKKLGKSTFDIALLPFVLYRCYQ